jgi:predicted dehydrogenase
MRRNASLASDYAKRHNVAKAYSDADLLINDPDVDAVYIATPPSSHLEYALKVAAAGKPAYVEKPMSVCAQECDLMIQAFKEKGLPLFVAYYRRLLPKFLHIKSILDNNRLGELQIFTIKHFTELKSADAIGWRVQPEISGGGLFHDMGSHTLDLIDYLIGPLHDVKGTSLNKAHAYAADDCITASFTAVRQDNTRVPGTGTWCFCAPYSDEYIEILGSCGVLKFSVFSDRESELRVRAPDEAATTIVENFVINHPQHIQEPYIQQITTLLLRGKEGIEEDDGAALSSGLCSGEAARRTNAVIDQITIKSQ